MDEPSDDLLMRAYAAGDAAAFERLYARHQAALYRFVHRLLGRDAATQADEVFQDTWLRAIQARHGWQPQGASFRTWLFTLAHHRAVDCLEGLPVAQKTAFLLVHEDGLSMEELARALDVGFETAKTRLRYAMSKLRTCMGAYLPARAG